MEKEVERGDEDWEECAEITKGGVGWRWGRRGWKGTGRKSQKSLTYLIEVAKRIISLSMVDEFSQGEKSKGVKQLDDGVARLMDGHHHYLVSITCQAIDRVNPIIEGEFSTGFRYEYLEN